MKVRESEMPEPERWQSFFVPERVLDALGLTGSVGDAVDFGCGYGTFSIPAAFLMRGTLHAIDLDQGMVEATADETQRRGLANLRAVVWDFVAAGTGLADGAVDYAMLFNLLPAEDPLALLREAHRVLAPSGRVGVMHWNYDAQAPRGPPMSIRPRPEDCRRWLAEADFVQVSPAIDLPPWHFGLTARKKKP
jgi:SAM-dependent methyltransferase